MPLDPFGALEPVATPSPPSEGATERIVAWVEDRLDGTVERIERQPRWRPVWFVDVRRDGELLELLVRGERTDMPLIFPLQHEMVLQEQLHGFGIPTPQVHGWIDDPAAYVMDRVGGRPISPAPPTPSARPPSTTTSRSSPGCTRSTSRPSSRPG